MSYYNIYAPTVSFPLCSVSIGRRMTLEAAQTLAANYPGSKIVEYCDNPVEDVIGPVRADRHDTPTPQAPETDIYNLGETEDGEIPDSAELVRTTDGSYRVIPRTIEPASSPDPFKRKRATPGRARSRTGPQSFAADTECAFPTATDDMAHAEPHRQLAEAQRGFEVDDPGVTGNPQGQQPRGKQTEQGASLVLVELVGKPWADATRDEQDIAIAKTRDGYRASRAALAAALQCDESTVKRRAARGRKIGSVEPK
jgi:hypothetical protein